MTRRTIILFGGLLVVLTGVNGLVIHKESVLSSGKQVFLELAPADPRSLMQGDYMRLDYAVSERLPRTADGHVVLQLDERGVGSFLRLHTPVEPLGANEQLLRFRIRDDEARVGSGAFFFQEGHAQYYASAEYGELRVATSGTSVLVGLCDENLQRIRPD